jgi:hypothetical protein
MKTFKQLATAVLCSALTPGLAATAFGTPSKAYFDKSWSVGDFENAKWVGPAIPTLKGFQKNESAT